MPEKTGNAMSDLPGGQRNGDAPRVFARMNNKPVPMHADVAGSEHLAAFSGPHDDNVIAACDADRSPVGASVETLLQSTDAVRDIAAIIEPDAEPLAIPKAHDAPAIGTAPVVPIGHVRHELQAFDQCDW
ncbi:hypothetical protein Hden_2963 [Hyphomicrobium denitrificans ATCC 51888]|uniref:Uncharacterized protein n=1 Tax=Hyphomicrobium denitrificans (strain ATCC 51888 / DSM 1869 / NCIMB 11706 / TK 0415) TaxID=582899 RepID=D8JVA4_HYPDA|nr:hypothetical protein Hden_2963 [Hyphomicrobium denitrificans ATCC 51888]